MGHWLRVMLVGAGVGFLAGTVSCDSVDAAFDCESVCSRYHDCYDQNYDVGKCRDNCRARAANDSSVRQAADVCEACIGDKSCVAATFDCAPSCSNIVP